MNIEVAIDNYGNKVAYYKTDTIIIPKGYLISKLKEFKHLLEQQLITKTGPNNKDKHDTQVYLHEIPHNVTRMDQMLALFSSHESDEFRIPVRICDIVEKFEAEHNYIQASELFCERLFFEGTLKETWYDVELSLTKGATIKPEVINIPAYISATLTSGLTYSYQAAGAIPLAENTANYINTSCRIFKCKDCGKLAYVRKEDDKDKDKCSKGMKPVKRCVACRAFKRDKEKLDRLTNYFS